MTIFSGTTLNQLEARLRAQSTEMADLRAAVDAQFTRIACRQTELDLLPIAEGRRNLVRAPRAKALLHDGRHRRHG